VIFQNKKPEFTASLPKIKKNAANDTIQKGEKGK